MCFSTYINTIIGENCSLSRYQENNHFKNRILSRSRKVYLNYRYWSVIALYLI